MTNKKRIITFFILMMIGLIVIFTGLWIRENRVLIINVEGYEIEYHPTDRKLWEILAAIECYGNDEGSSLDEISDKLGEPDAWVGYSIPDPAYFLDDNRVAVFSFSSYSNKYTQLRRIALYRENGDIRVINADTEQREESSESIRHFYKTITDDMLNACDAESYRDAYWNDPLVLLNEFNENNKNVKLYGISVAEEAAMILTIDGEKVLIEYPFRNLWNYRPLLNVCDIDSDGMDEVIISLRTVCGPPYRRYVLFVCDYEKKWNVYMYDDYVEDVEAIIKSKFENGIFTYLDNDGNILWESAQIWDQATEYEATNFESDMGFYARKKEIRKSSNVVLDDSILLFQNGSYDDETVIMEIVPWIELDIYEEYGWSSPIRFVFYVGFSDGDFEITGYAGYWYRIHA